MSRTGADDRLVALSRRRLLTFAGAGALTAVSSRLVAQSVDVRGRGYDPLWRTAEETIETFLGRGPYAREGLVIGTDDYVDNGSSVPLTIRIASPMTAQDHPRVVHVLAHANPNPQVVSAWFTPEAGRAEFSTRIRLERSQRITAVAQMSDGRLLRADEDVEIRTGACADDSTGTAQDIASFRPQSRISVPPAARRGDIITLRALISHPMETGLRLNEFDDWVRQRIISRFACAFNGRLVFRARLYPAVSANPFFQFHARAQDSGVYDFEWYDTQDMTFTNRGVIDVT
jgi:thiosulfate oxidation carrier complex protein SoxZ